jgi:hypothetical protein
MDIKTYVNSKKTYINVGFFGIDIGFGFPIVYPCWTKYMEWISKPISIPQKLTLT